MDKLNHLSSSETAPLNSSNDIHSDALTVITCLFQWLQQQIDIPRGTAHECSEWQTMIEAMHYVDEPELVDHLVAELDAPLLEQAACQAQTWINELRQQPQQQGFFEQLLQEFNLDNEEGLALMVLAESLLRIPDTATQDALIQAELTDSDWQAHIKRQQPLWLNMVSRALSSSALIERWLDSQQDQTASTSGHLPPESEHLTSRISQQLKTLIARSGEPIIRQAIFKAIKLLGQQFVLAENIEQGLKRSDQASGWHCCSFDMLGEAALTTADAEHYCESYRSALKAIAEHRDQSRATLENTDNHLHSLSIKLSALHPRYQQRQKSRVMATMVTRLEALVKFARQLDIAVTLDAEEAARLEFSLELFERVFRQTALGWGKFGIALQAYGKRCLPVIGWLTQLARETDTRIPVRLVKGAYWDSEIKLAQQQGCQDYPVLTEKAATDLQYLLVAKLLMQRADNLTPQFATHNAHTLAAIQLLAKQLMTKQHMADQPTTEPYCGHIEMQRLHGMGEALYQQANISTLPVRLYAPIGPFKELLPYLVRRLMENTANTSFVHYLWDTHYSSETLSQSPLTRYKEDIKGLRGARTGLRKPYELFAPKRLNSAGYCLDDHATIRVFQQQLAPWKSHQWHMSINTEGLIETLDTTSRDDAIQENNKSISAQPSFSPANQRDELGSVDHQCGIDGSINGSIDHSIVCSTAIHQSTERFFQQQGQPLAPRIRQRAFQLKQWADLLQQHQFELIALLIREAGKTWQDSLDELREAIDFCRYYASEATQLMLTRHALPSVTGEHNSLSYVPRGPWLCISPWNFPLAIFIGQISAAYSCGNPVLVKPASSTQLIAYRALQLAYQAGIDPIECRLLSIQHYSDLDPILTHPQLAGVAFTGSLSSAKHIQQQLVKKSGGLIHLIAETGGQNAMLVDSTALLHQVVKDVMRSAFSSAGQRCSACRILCLQEDIADDCLNLLTGTVAEMHIGHPWQPDCDMGPLISDEAVSAASKHLAAHQNKRIMFKDESHESQRSSATKSNLNGFYLLPEILDFGLFEFSDPTQLQDLNKLFSDEIFAPILHVIRYRQDQKQRLIDWLNRLGYGLTLAVHSRNPHTIKQLQQIARCGNIYINRDQVGAVVESQPFGGMGLSGTGPKAGGPNYLKAFIYEKTISENSAAIGGDIDLLSTRRSLH